MYEIDGHLIARISSIDLLISEDLASQLQGLQGLPIAILRTDDEAKPYRLRVIAPHIDYSERTSELEGAEL